MCVCFGVCVCVCVFMCMQIARSYGSYYIGMLVDFDQSFG